MERLNIFDITICEFKEYYGGNLQGINVLLEEDFFKEEEKVLDILSMEGSLLLTFYKKKRGFGLYQYVEICDLLLKLDSSISDYPFFNFYNKKRNTVPFQILKELLDYSKEYTN